MVGMAMPAEGGPGVTSASFLGMWMAMTVVMMLPSLAPALWRYRRTAARAGAVGPARLTALVAAGYFTVWAALGAILHAVRVALLGAAERWPALARATPVAAVVVVLLAAALQSTAWKARHLACCRDVPCEHGSRARSATAWRDGLRLGLHCVACCAGLTAILLVVGMMDVTAMAVVTAAITLERLAPAGPRLVRPIAVVVAGVAMLLLVRSSDGVGAVRHEDPRTDRRAVAGRGVGALLAELVVERASPAGR